MSKPSPTNARRFHVATLTVQTVLWMVAAASLCNRQRPLDLPHSAAPTSSVVTVAVAPVA